MSIKITQTAFRVSGLPSGARLVLLGLADFADDTGRCFPSVLKLAAKCGLGSRQVLRNLQLLQKARHVSLLKRGDGRGHSNHYHVHPVEQIAAVPPAPLEERVPSVTGFPGKSLSPETGIEEVTMTSASPAGGMGGAKTVSSKPPVETGRVSSRTAKGVMDATPTIMEPSFIVKGNPGLTTNTASGSSNPSRPSPAPQASDLPYDSQAFVYAWQEWEKHRKESRKPLTPTTRRAQLASLRDMGEARALNALQHSTAQGYQGLFEPRALGNSLTQTQNPSDHTGERMKKRTQL